MSNESESMSFGKLMTIFGGVMVVGVVGAVAFISYTAKQGQAVSVVTKHSQPQQERQGAQQGQQGQQGLNRDVLSVRPHSEEELRNAKLALASQSATQLESVKQVVQQGNALVVQRLDGVSTDITTLDRRVSALEGKRAAPELVVKPKRKAKPASAVKQLAKGATPIPASSGYKVQSTVGNRAWVQIGDSSESIEVGDTLPPVVKPLRVVAIDSDSGIVITTHDR